MTIHKKPSASCKSPIFIDSPGFFRENAPNSEIPHFRKQAHEPAFLKGQHFVEAPTLHKNDMHEAASMTTVVARKHYCCRCCYYAQETVKFHCLSAPRSQRANANANSDAPRIFASELSPPGEDMGPTTSTWSPPVNGPEIRRTI